MCSAFGVNAASECSSSAQLIVQDKVSEHTVSADLNSSITLSVCFHLDFKVLLRPCTAFGVIHRLRDGMGLRES